VTEPGRQRVRVTAGAEKTAHGMRPEKPLIANVGPGFDSRHLHRGHGSSGTNPHPQSSLEGSVQVDGAFEGVG
jgi:hypothetical protein